METLMTLARVLHSWTRWAFVIVAVVALVIFVLGLLQRQPWSKRAHSILNAYGSLLGLQWLFGVILLVSYGSVAGFNQRHLWEHLTIQTVAMIVANVHHAWRRRELADSVRWRNGLIVIVVSLVLAIVGIVLLPVGIQWRFFVP